MQWTKATITTTTLGTEIISAQLMDLGIHGVEINDPHEITSFLADTCHQWDYIDESLLNQQAAPDAFVIFYLGTDNESHVLLSQVEKALEDTKANYDFLCPLSLTLETVNDQDWLHEWKKHFHPIKIGKVLIIPEWENTNHDDEIVFTIDPGSAFGTGQHATTMLCIEALQEHLHEKDNILDIGCGSGILSIISLLLGAQTATACDIDPAAVEITKRNAQLNPINQSLLEVHVGDILSNPELLAKISIQHYDIVVANIVADIIIMLAPLINNLLKPGGKFIASGIIDERLEDVLLSLSANNLTVSQSKTSEGWCCTVVTNE